jgi:hypothetical protein
VATGWAPRAVDELSQRQFLIIEATMCSPDERQTSNMYGAIGLTMPKHRM